MTYVEIAVLAILVIKLFLHLRLYEEFVRLYSVLYHSGCYARMENISIGFFLPSTVKTSSVIPCTYVQNKEILEQIKKLIFPDLKKI